MLQSQQKHKFLIYDFSKLKVFNEMVRSALHLGFSFLFQATEAGTVNLERVE